MYKTEEEEEEEKNKATIIHSIPPRVCSLYICVLLFHLLLPLADYHFKFLTKQITSILAFFCKHFLRSLTWNEMRSKGIAESGMESGHQTQSIGAWI
jgi:hypothetical protein